MSVPDFKTLGVVAQSFADMICELPADVSQKGDEDLFADLAAFVWDASSSPPDLIRQRAAMAGLVKPLQWYRCSPLEQRWWLAFGLLINAARESVSRPLVDHDTVMPKRPRVSLRDTIFEQSDGVGARLYADEDDAFNRKGRSRAVSSKQVVVTRPTAPEPQEPEPAAPPYSADEVDAMRRQLSPGEIADLPPDQRAAYASRMGFPSESGGVPMSWRRPTSPAPSLPPHEQVSVSADVDGEKLTGSAMVSKPQD